MPHTAGVNQIPLHILLLLGGSMGGITGRGNLVLTAGDSKGNAALHSDLIREKPEKLEYSSKNVFSIGFDKSLFSSLIPPIQMRQCHCCGLAGSLRCSQCKQVHYCSTNCQKKDWPAHKTVCQPVNQNVSNNSGGKLPAKVEKGVYLKGDAAPLECLKTEEHISKVMLSDLQTPGIRKAMEVQGTVTEFKSPREFYIQMSSPAVLDQISKLSVKLQDCYANTAIQEEYRAIKGEVCVVRSSLYQTWSRALVKDVDTLQKKAQVFYLDYGNEEKIPLSWMKALQRDVKLLFPPCVIRCSFANYNAKEKGWNERMASFSSQLKGRHCSVTIVDILQEEIMLNFAVDVVVPDFGEYLPKVPVEMRSDFTPGSNAKRAGSPKVPETYSKGRKEKIPADEEFLHCANSVMECISVSVGESFSGVISYIQNPENFFCQQVDSARQLAELQMSLNEHCARLPTSPAFHPAAGNVCCAQFTEDNIWYRAAVLACPSEDAVSVGYIDYGNLEVLPLSRLRPMAPRLAGLPAQAIRCTLAGVKPPLGGWTSEAISIMKQLVNDKVLTIKVVGKESYGSVVELVDASLIPAINLSDHLVEKGFAAKEPRVAPAAARRRDVQPAKEASFGHWKPMELAVGETLYARVTEVDSPDLFYAVPVPNKDEEKLCRQLTELADYCKSCKSQPFTPRQGEACCAEFSGDGCWYRALVLNTTQATVRVLYTDYGNTETLPLSKVLPIPDSHLELPFRTIMCSLAGIKKAEWSPSLVDKLKEIVLNKHVRITVKGINENIHLVMVEKLSESSCLNVADQLLLEGLVRPCTDEKLQTKQEGHGGEAKCCCAELETRVKKLEQMMLLLSDKFGFPEMRNLLDH
ncbi:tudor domain-containing protein 1 isoform X1 [Heliangelus exortis]|uniref:tudor domain-containing protein 1 isoform X1 n=2 Tax=Heliangelus exortis TaxID=472823 RepID=UPI003A95892C